MEDLSKYINAYLSYLPCDIHVKTKINKIKQLMSFLFKGSPQLLSKRQTILTATNIDLDSFLKFSLALLLES